jgi:hypothetical protein
MPQPQPISLTDSELEAIMDAARPLQVHQRDAFLRDIATELAGLPMIGAGALHRIIAAVQRRHFDAPDLRVHESRSRAYP